MRATPALLRRLWRYYLLYAAGFVGLVLLLAVAERFGLAPRWIGQIFLFSTIAIYALIGVMSRTSDVSEYYVAGRRIPAMYNGMEKATYALAFLGAIALIIATIVGHLLSGKAMIPLRQAYEKQRQFAADASHELRTPLAVVMASAELLQNDPSIKSPFLRQVIDDVRDEVKKMTKLVSDLLVVARSDNKALKLKPQKFNLSALIEQTARLMQPLADQKKIDLQAEHLPKVEIQADEQKIRQLVLILVDNAVKYCDDKGTIDVSLRRGRLGKGAVVAVTNTYADGANVDYSHFFERFYRGDTSHNSQKAGYGIGLSMAEELTKLMGGKINVSYKAQRITFTVRLG